MPIRPGRRALHIAQDRLREKDFLSGLDIRTTRYRDITSLGILQAVLADIGTPAILKTRKMGYDGKGQARCGSAAEARGAWEAMGRVPCTLERALELALELSVVLARGFDGVCAAFPVAANVHEAGVLATSTVPSGATPATEAEARRQALALADGLDYHGVLGVEFFVDVDGRLWFNEMAPRPHNSAHYTLDASATSQFEQQLRALCALPLGDVSLRTPVTMVNLLGDLWRDGAPPAWEAALGAGGARLHLYGKAEPRPGRKMGHVNCPGADGPSALGAALGVRRALGAARGTA